MLHRYFIITYFWETRFSSTHSTRHLITEGQFPNLKMLWYMYNILTGNVTSLLNISEVKSLQDLRDYFGNETMPDICNYGERFKEIDNF